MNRAAGLIEIPIPRDLGHKLPDLFRVPMVAST